jgi:16S rRNA (cytidine1402-2'-O)-methyltransferase
VKGTLYLVPVTLGTEKYKHVLPADVISTIIRLRHFIVEDLRSARRFLRLIDKTFPIDDCEFYILNEHTNNSIIGSYLNKLDDGTDAGLMSEAGVPCVADPGSPLIRIAHEKSIRIVPLTGPSSIILALMASGLNGQNFSFKGYIPIKKEDRSRAIKELEHEARKGSSQIIIEAPYRNQKLLEEILATCKPETYLCIAVDISMDSEFIRTQNVRTWQKNIPQINKRPAIFIIGT